MKNSSLFLIAGFFIIAVGLAWIISGGISAPSAGTEHTTTLPTTTSTAAPATPVTTEVTVPATAETTALATIPPVATTEPPRTATTAISVISGDDVRNHFLDIAYTSTNRLERLDQHPERPRIVVSASSASDDDIAVLEKTINSFNAASKTVKLSENVKETDSGDILIRFLPAEGLDAIDLNTAADTGPFYDVLTRRELYQGDVLAAKALRGTVYINGNLKGDAKKHMLVRGLMYEMGLTGETAKYPDSVFYVGENTNVDFSPIDKKAIAMLYETQFYNGMNAEGLRQVLYVP
jgi:hypothetical protein